MPKGLLFVQYFPSHRAPGEIEISILIREDVPFEYNAL